MSGPYDQQAVNQSTGRTVGGAVGQVGGQTVVTQQVTSAGRRGGARNGSSSSSSSSNDGLRANAGAVSGVGVVGGGFQNTSTSYQQFSAESQYAQQGGSGVGFVAGNESFGSTVSGQRRQGRYQKQVIRLPDQQGQVRQVRRRLPTPEPDTLERVYVQRTGAEIVEEITEIPTTPPPRVQERTVVEPAGPPQVVKRTIRVPPRSGAYGGYQQQQQQQQQQGFGQQVTGAFTGGATFGNDLQGSFASTGGFSGGAQQAAAAAAATTNYQQQTSGSFVGGYGATAPFAAPPAATTFVTNYGSLGGAGGLPQSKGPVTGPVSFVINAGSSQAVPSATCQPAFCFYV